MRQNREERIASVVVQRHCLASKEFLHRGEWRIDKEGIAYRAQIRDPLLLQVWLHMAEALKACSAMVRSGTRFPDPTKWQMWISRMPEAAVDCDSSRACALHKFTLPCAVVQEGVHCKRLGTAIDLFDRIIHGCNLLHEEDRSKDLLIHERHAGSSHTEDGRCNVPLASRRFSSADELTIARCKRVLKPWLILSNCLSPTMRPKSSLCRGFRHSTASARLRNACKTHQSRTRGRGQSQG